MGDHDPGPGLLGDEVDGVETGGIDVIGDQISSPVLNSSPRNTVFTAVVALGTKTKNAPPDRPPQNQPGPFGPSPAGPPWSALRNSPGMIPTPPGERSGTAEPAGGRNQTNHG